MSWSRAELSLSCADGSECKGDVTPTVRKHRFLLEIAAYCCRCFSHRLAAQHRREAGLGRQSGKMGENMTMYKSLYAITFLVLFASVARAENKQEGGKQLIARAVELSDIRAIGASAFRMKASLRVLGKGPADEGNYSEIWVSREQWRREIEVGSFRRVEVGGPKKDWLLDSGKVIPGTAPVLKTLSLGSMPKKLKVKEIVNKDLGGVAALCVQSETDLGNEVFCIDPKTETLLIHESRSRASRSSHFSYVYRNYEKFGDHLFPRSVQYRSEGEAEVEINVSELNSEDSPNPSDFTPLSGALETTNCLPNEMTPPRTLSAPGPDFPGHAHTNEALVILWMIVGVDGRAHDIQVVRSGGDIFDTEAVRTVGRWRFEAPRCRGEAVAAPINVEVNFRR